MDRACFGKPNGPLVTPTEFIQRATPQYKAKGILPYCKACQEVVHVYGVHSPNPDTTPRFDHADRDPDANELDDCVLANRSSRQKGLEPSGWDDERAQTLRAHFFEEDNLRLAYGFCLALCRHGNLPAGKFKSMIRRADKKKIWAYADIPLWAIPYVLLTLENFTAKNKEGGTYDFHFVFNKPRKTNVAALWEKSSECQLVKVFQNSGEPFSADDNPFPVSANALAAKAGDVNWIRPEFLRLLIP